MHRAVVRRLGIVALAGLILLSACSPSSSPSTSTASGPSSDPDALNIIAGSEQQKILEDIVMPWCKAERITCTYALKGSVDQAQMLKSGATDYDAYWFASTVFLQLGDANGRLRHIKPMFITPLVYAGWKSEMEKLGFVGRDVSVAEILDAVESGKTTAWLTNPTQSNSGATVLFGFMNYFAGNGPGEPLTAEQLDSAPVQEGVTRFVRAMDSTPPSTGTLVKDCIKNETTCRTMFVYEALVIENNQQLVRDGHEPLYAVYPQESLSIADAPMGFLPPQDQANSAKEDAFLKLQAYLLTAEAQQKVQALGRRPVTSIGLSLENADPKVFNPDWGIKATLRERPITYPAANVIETTLARYQTQYRRPVDAIYCLDSSGSMEETGWADLVEASEIIFDQERAGQYYLQAHPEDMTTVLVFNSDVAGGPWTAEGNDSGELRGLYEQIRNHSPGGGTNMYRCLNEALRLFDQHSGQNAQDNRKQLIINMTDGRSETDGASEFAAEIERRQIPVISIVFGDSDTAQLQDLADQSRGSVVTKDNLIDALREATGYK